MRRRVWVCGLCLILGLSEVCAETLVKIKAQGIVGAPPAVPALVLNRIDTPCDGKVEFISEDDARLISALLAPRIEEHLSTQVPLLIQPNPILKEAECLAVALELRLRSDGFKAALWSSDAADAYIFLSVTPLPRGIWVRVFSDDNPLFLAFEREPAGQFQLVPETSPSISPR